MSNIEENDKWEPRGYLLMFLICQAVGTSLVTRMPSLALVYGVTGCLISFVLTYIFLGIPLLYMELTVSQFSARDIINIWKVRPCFSHCGYIILIWQFFELIYNHILLSLVFHYLIMSFESPIPYTVCGNWANFDCNLLATNYTVFRYCLKKKPLDKNICTNIYKSFPQYQYRKYSAFMIAHNDFQEIWRVSLASVLACAIIFCSCYKRHQSIKRIIKWVTIYPCIGFAVLMIGSMLQKGVVAKYAEAFDADFKMFNKNFRWTNIVLAVMHSAGIGSGLAFNLAASSTFRSPCYSNAVITMVVAAAFTALVMSSTAIATCPLLFKYGLPINEIFNIKMSMTFEIYPVMLQEYDYTAFYLILLYSSIAVLELRTEIILFHSIHETMAKRLRLLGKYPGLTTFLSIIMIFIMTLPFLCYYDLRKCCGKFMTLIPCFIAIMECLVFVICYGVDKFSEDLHFMQGIKPTIFMKLSWLASIPILTYTVCYELYLQCFVNIRSANDIVGWVVFGLFFGLIFILVILRLLVALCNKRFKKLVQLDTTWGPKSELLLRSRAMFSAQAMTKEYMYRQYNLQAGILARQRVSNKRVEIKECPLTYTTSM